MNAQINATVAGVPRIGPKRELKKALETYWKDATTGRNLATVAPSWSTSRPTVSPGGPGLRPDHRP